MTLRRISVFTGNRAEYGLLKPLLHLLARDDSLDLSIVVSGAHLEQSFGGTLNEIEADFPGRLVCAPVTLESDSLFDSAQAIGTGIITLAETFNSLRPDIVVVYADRFETFAATIAASQMGLPVAHIEGGDVTEGGTLDDSVRHAITKLSHLHFTTNSPATNRILAMGEEAWRVETVGLMGIETAEENIATPDELAERYEIDLKKPIVVYTQHAIATAQEQSVADLKIALSALKSAAQFSQIIITYPNNDAGGRALLRLYETEASLGLPKGIQILPSLGRRNYEGFLALAQHTKCRVVCAGNSSSVVKETPKYKCPAVNLGGRQSGRLQSTNVINSAFVYEDILGALKTALFDVEFRSNCQRSANPYSVGTSVLGIHKVLKEVKLDKRLVNKRMATKGEVKNGWFR